MKARNLLLGLLLGAVVLLPACSSNSPTAPPPSPTPVAFSISLTAAPAETLVNGGILLSARITSGGRDVPDNTSVTFTISSCVPGQTTSPGFGENMVSMTCETTRTTSAGVAAATIWSSTEGTYEVVARVPGQTAKVNVKWSQPVNPGALAVYSITPKRGRPEGGEQATIYGRGLAKPLTVDFVAGGNVGHAQVLSVNAAATEMTIVTPPLAGDITGEVVADVRVTAAAGTSGQTSDTLVGGYTYERTFGEPRIYAIDPPRGAWAGGEQVTITGANFFTDVRVRFGAEEGQVVSVSADRARITVLTPRHGGSLTEEQIVDATVVTRAGTVQEQQVTLADAYTYLPDTGVPVLYNVVPSKGSPRGGETVVLTGKNFTQPLQVEFIVGAPVNATLPATVVNVNAAGTIITLTTPQASPQDLPDDTLADIRITNLVGSANSESATFLGVYTYTKESKLLDVYSVFPNRGPATGGQTVVIAGRGFVAPVKVDFIALGGSRPAEVIEVGAGGQTIKVLTPSVPQQITTELVVDVRVTAAADTPLQQQATLTAAYTYERPFGAPRIFAVVPNKGSYSGGEQVTIYGANFFEPLGVAFGTEVVRVLSFTQDQIVVQTRLHTDNFITEELTVPVTVVTRFDTGLQQTVTVEDAYTYLPNTGVPQLYTVVPSRGSPRGGETVTLTGRHFHQPLSVEFIIGAPVGATRPATVVDVVKNADGTMTARVITPQASPDPLATDAATDIRITNLVGTAITQTATFTGAFTYDREAKDIVIYSLAPNRGSANGGEQVTIHGKGFAAPAQVDFLIGGVAHAAAVVSVTDDTIVCTTPAVPESQNAEVTADVKVTAAFGLPTQKDATLAQAFTFVKEFEAPRIYSISPETGRIEGNQTVTIYGSGFFEPVRVTLRSGSFPVNCQTVILPSGVLVEICEYVDQIEDAEVIDVPDSETIIIRTPGHPNAKALQDVDVDVKVFTRWQTAQEQSVQRDRGFTYKADYVAAGTPIIFSIVPDKGPRAGGQEVVIRGENLCGRRLGDADGRICDPAISPVVTFALGAPLNGTLKAEVLSFTADGRSLVVRTPQASVAPLTADVSATVTVTNAFNDTETSDQVLNGYTYVADYVDPGIPTIFSIHPVTGSRLGGDQVEIRGENLCSLRAGQAGGFECVGAPAVTFALGAPLSGTLNAEVVADSWLPDGKKITVITPRASTYPLTADVKATVAVANANGNDQVVDGFTYLRDEDFVSIYSIAPNRGRPEGGQAVTIYGRGFTQPVKVDFVVAGSTRPATVTAVNAAGTEITLTTPATNVDTSVEHVADVRVTAAAGTANERSETLASAYTYEKRVAAPQIYTITPDKVLENSAPFPVTIYGASFVAPVRVTLGAENATVQSVSADGSTIQILTPLHSGGPGTVDVTVTTRFETAEQQQVVRAGGFTWLPKTVEPNAPTAYTINPNRGSRLGGEEVTLTGQNLCNLTASTTPGVYTCSEPPQVAFVIGAPVNATRSAEVTYFAPDGRTIRVRTPQASPEPILTDATATVTVTNNAGTAQLLNAFIYLRDETPLAIYSVVPSRGRPEGGQTVTIFGRGFVGPIVNVDFTTAAGGTRAAEVVSFNAAGNEIVVKTPATGVDASVEHVAAITVTVAVGTANQKDVTLDGAYTYEKRYAAPLIYSVVPNKGSYAGGDTLQIIGANFLTPLRVTLGGEDAEVLASSTESVLQVKTPLHPNTHLTQELTVDVTVYTSFETLLQQQASLAGGFTWIPDTGVPQLYGVVPNKGNPRGGEAVVLTGSNFTPPVTVEFLLGAPFGTTLPATVVSVNATGTQITVTTPQVSPTPVTSEVVTGIRITNLVGSSFSQNATFQGVFTYESESNLAIYAVTPNRGKAEGGDTVQILGRGFITPVDVDFIVAGQARPAEVVSVTGDTEIVVLSPATGLDATTERIADIQVTAAAGTANQIVKTIANAYTYEKYFGAPAIYAVIPDRGSYAGNEVVTVVGANFFTPLRVFFGAEEGTVDTAASTATTLVVRTPQHLQGHLTEDLTVDVRVQTRFDTAQQQEVTLAGGFTWKPDTGVPLLYSVTPNRGDPRGGEEITLVGKNFTQPVVVEFILGAPVGATYPATVVSVDAAGGVMKVRTPQASPSPLTQEVEVDIRITNLVGSASSQNATFLKTFTYNTESDLAIYTVQPNRGSPTGGQTVEIRGRGFVPTVNVHFLVGGQERQAQVVAVTDGGTRVEIRTPASNVDATVEQVADVRLTVAAGTANQKSTTLAASYTYEKQFAAPAIYAVVPNRGAHAGGETIEILGSGFFAPVRVTLGSEPAEVLAGSTETKLLVKTPVHNPSHLTADLTVDVTVLTRFETAQQQQAVLPGGFTWVPDSGAPILYQVVPAKGSPRGGEEVLLIGRNFTAPVTVDFILGAPLGTTLPATVLEVIANANGTQTIRIKTPQASPTPVTTDVVTAIRIANLVGSANSQNATFQGVFTYEGESRTPLVYFVEPDKGSPRGGETVTVYGRFFLPPVRVQFTFTANGVTKTVDAEVVSRNAEGTEITVITPTASLEPLSDDAPADIRVTSEYSTGRDQTATLPEGFLYLAERPTPELYALTPNSGPIEGGTRVTITGAGFQYPVQVFFTIPTYGAIQAQVVSVNFSRIVVIAPSITPMAPDTPTIASVTAINMESGKISNALSYRYGNAMFISAIAPTEGPDIGGTMVTLFGQGFVAPVAVTLAGVPAQILTVAGTEIVVKSNAPSDRQCEPFSGPVRVTNIDSNLSADGPSFTYRPARPLITSVEVFAPQVPPGNNIVREYDPTRAGACSSNDAYSTYTVIVRGENFEQYPGSSASAMSVVFTNPDVEVLTTWVSATEVRFTLPDLSAVELDTAACTINGAPGLRDIPTGIPFTIRNNNNLCEDELDPAIIIEPCDPNCRAGIIQVSLTPPSLTLGIGTTATMTACISAVQTGPTNIAISTSGTTGIVDYSLDGVTYANGVTVVVPAAQVCETFTIRGLSGGSVGTVAALDVSLGGSTDVSQITVGALSLTLSPTTLNLPVGGTGLLTIQLSAPAPAGGAPVLVAQAGPIGKISFGPLTGTCTNPPAFPATQNCNLLVAPITSFTVVIPAGSSTYTFPVNGLNASPPGPVTVSATLDPTLGGASASSAVVVGQFNVTLSPSTLNIPVGGNGTFTVTLDAPAYDFDPSAAINGIPVAITQTGPGGVISITSDTNGSTAGGVTTGPTGQVVIETGTQIATFTVNGVSGGGPVTVTVSLPAGVGGATASSSVTVSTYVVTLTPDSLLIPLGTDGNFIVTLNAPAPSPAGARIYISQVGQVGIIELRDSTGAGILPGPPPNGQYVDIPANQSSAAFRVRGLQEGGPIQVTATLDPALGSSADTSIVSVGTLTLAAQPTALTVPVNGSNTFILTLSKAQTTATVVSLASANNSIAIPWNGVSSPPVADTSVTIPAGSLTSPPVYVYGVNLGPTTIYASLAPTLGGATAQIAINVTQAIQFVPASLTVPVGSLGTFTLQVAAAQANNTTIQLDYSGTGGAVSGPATVTLLANQNTVQFSVWALKPTATPVSIVATLPNSLPAGLAGASAIGTVSATGLPYALTFNPSVINLPVGASVTVTASFNYPLPPTGYGIAYPLGITPTSPAPGTVFTLGDVPLSFAASAQSDTFTVTAVGNGGPYAVTGIGPAELGSPTGTATVTIGPATTTLTMSPSPFMWVLAAPAPTITVSISPQQANPTIVQLQSSNPAVVTVVPATVTIPANTSSASFTPTIVGTGTATITATIPPAPAPAGVSVQAAALAATTDVTVFTITRSPDDLTIPAGGSGLITLTLSDPLPAAVTGATAVITPPGPTYVSITSPFTIPAGVTTLDIPVTATAPGSGDSVNIVMPTSVGGTVLPGTTLTVDALSFTLGAADSTIYVGSSTVATVTTASPVASDTVVTLDQSVPGSVTIPATVTIPAGGTTAIFTITGLTLGGPLSVSAELPAALSATPETVPITVADLPLALTAPSDSVYLGSSLLATASIAPAVRAVDTTVTLSQANGGGTLVIPASVVIPAGSSSATFTVLPGVVGDRDLFAALPAGVTSVAAPQDGITPIHIYNQTLTLTPDPMSLAPNTSQAMTATISAPPVADVTVALVSTDPGLFTVPPSVVIPAGLTSATFDVTAASANTPVAPDKYVQGTLPAALTGVAGPHAEVKVTIYALNVVISPSVVGPLMAGGGHTFTVVVDQAQSFAMDVMLYTSSSQVSVPASVQIPAGETSATFLAIAEEFILAAPAVTITAELPGTVGGDTGDAIVTSISRLTVAASPNNVNIPAATEQPITVTTGVTLAKDVTIALASAQPEMVGLFDADSNPAGSLTIPAGSSSGTFRVRGVGVGTGTSVYLDTPAALGGTNPTPEATTVVNVLGLQLQFNVASYTVAHGAVSPASDLEAILTDGGGGTITTVIPVTVRITSADPTSVLLRGPGGDPVGASPIDIVIPASDDRQTFRVFGNSPGGPFAVTGALLPPVGNDTAVLQVGVTNLTGAWTASASTGSVDAAGGTVVTITGSASHSFWSNVEVWYGTTMVPLGNYTLRTPTVLVFSTPALPAGTTVAVEVRNPSVPEFVGAGTADVFGAFTLTSVTPDVGPDNVGTPVTVSGTGFTPGASYTLNFGGALFSGTATSTTTITGSATAHVAGIVALTVTDPLGESQILADAFTYYDQPNATSLSPNVGPAAGGGTITIGGTGFLPGGTYSVSFGGVPATDVVAVSTTVITCTLPPGAPPSAMVTVTDAAGQSDPGPVQFNYYPAPGFASVAPTSRPITGGAITITGTFRNSGSYTVTIDPAGTPAACTGPVVTATTIACTAGAHPAASGLTIEIVDAAGQSVTSGPAFAYTATLTLSSVTSTNGATTSAVTSTPVGVNCAVGTSGVCSAPFAITPVTLTPTPILPDTGWSWGGSCGCPANTVCAVPLTASPTTCSVVFN